MLRYGCLLGWLIWFGCGTPAAEAPPSPGTPGALPQYADGFRIEQTEAGTRLTVLRPWPGAEQQFVYHLFETEAGEATVIPTPIRRIVTTSTTHTAMLEALGATDRIVGHAGTAWVYSPAVQARIEAGHIAEVGQEGSLNYEQVVALEPDLVMASSMGAEDYAAYGKLRELGIPVVVNGEYAEATPLGRAEWLRFVAALVGKEDVADSLFAGIAARYEALAARAAEIPARPTVFTGGNWRGTWYVGGGKSYVARFLADAGADYLWRESDVQGTLHLDFETVFARAHDGDVWLNPGSWETLEAGLTRDERYAEFEAWQTGRVYFHDKRLSDGGGNDLYESGVVQPDVILADLIQIFHPGQMPDRSFVYYRQIPRSAATR